MRAWLGALALLAGCAAPAEGPREAASAPETTIAGAETALPLTVWAPEGPPRAVMLALHGFGDYGPPTFGSPEDGGGAGAGPFWAESGILVYAYDQRGFGRNPSNRDWPGSDALVADLEAVAAALRARHPELPLVVAGVSMGGAVALAAAGEGRLAGVDGLVLLAPALWGGESLGALYRASAWTAAQVSPETRFSARSSPVRIYPTDDWEMLRRVSKDPLRFANPSAREFLGLIRLMDRAVQAAPEARLPALTVMGANDDVIPEESVRAGHALLPGPKRFAYVETGWHMLLRDKQARRVHEIVRDWVLEQAE
ncbi:MAG: alpha/beta fold hydrolase [Pseudomonadota bacterium]